MLPQSDLSKCAILLGVTHGAFGRRRKDKDETEKINSDHGAPKDAAAVNKQLLRKEAFDAYDKLVDTIDDFFKKNTSPFSEGLRVLPLKNFQHCMETLRGFRPKWEQVVDEFIDRLPGEVSHWESTINGLFRAEDYPRRPDGTLDLDEIRARFKFEIKPMPVPAGGHYLLDLAQTQLDDLRAVTDETMKSAAEVARLDPYRRLAQLLVKIITRQKMFKELWNDASDELATLRRMSIGDDKSFDDLLDAAEQLLKSCGTGERLLKDEPARNKAADEAKAILKQMEGYL